MKYNVVENWRDAEGNHRDPWCLCSFCGGITEAMVKFDSDVGYGSSLQICKGCLSNMIKSINDCYIDHMRYIKAMPYEDDGYPD